MTKTEVRLRLIEALIPHANPPGVRLDAVRALEEYIYRDVEPAVNYYAHPDGEIRPLGKLGATTRQGTLAP
jgi:hypothetical protein